MYQKHYNIRVADKSGKVLGWIAAKNTFAKFDWDAIRFPTLADAESFCIEKGLTIIGVNCYK